ncbi:MAG: OmpA family protein [Chitinophagia bacterium]|jgi:outer membrane protein OmpA-like peptidoglycan-associated protein
MKKFMLFVVAVSMSAVAFSQPMTSYKKQPTLGVSFFLKDMNTANLIDKTSLSNALTNNLWTKVADMAPGLSVNYYHGLTDYIDFQATLAGSFTKYPFSFFSGVAPSTDNKFLMELSTAANIKLLTDKHVVVPYIHLGVGASMYGGNYFAAYAPTGAGLQFKLSEGTFVNALFGYNIKVSGLSINHLNYSIGIASPLKDKKPVVVVAPPPPPPPPPADTDKDGIIDTQDKCPTVPGVAKYQGCPVPDTDGDGINDENDKCPTVKGLTKYQGCPIPDTDKDGINDEEDKCPTVPGLARYQGCPIPDSDGDGVNDEEDKCPTIKGIAANSGCPDIKDSLKVSARSIYFLTGSDKFAYPKLAPEKLKYVLEALNKYPVLKIDIEGHTDITGSAKLNKALSQKRANTIMNFLISKGIAKDRLTATGYGSEKPVASNKTAKGRQENRRVELLPRF